ncbi:DNA pilot protein [Dipodfec virus UA06Rod_12]|uniref:DNA pilot protein n=1 Tax=Dipodfec virus UA06Rod_12 TaxID=2929316 RepID=A0A976N199_9VIRU|nr:DNA pilot protein [Dipodfec virus UA06Rod_12]
MNVSALTGGLLGAGLQMASQAIGYNYQKKLMALQQSYNVENWNRQNEYDLPTNQRSRLLDAGINPLFTDGSQMSSMISPVSQSTPPAGDLSRGVDAYANIMNAESQKTASMAEADYKKALTVTEDGLRDGKLDFLGLQVEFQGVKNKAERQNMAVQLYDLQNRINESLNTIAQRWKALSLEEQRTIADTALKKIQTQLAKKDLDSYSARFALELLERRANIDLLKASSRNQYAQASEHFENADRIYHDNNLLYDESNGSSYARQRVEADIDNTKASANESDFKSHWTRSNRLDDKYKPLHVESYEDGYKFFDRIYSDIISIFPF